MLFCLLGFCDAGVTLCNVSITLSKLILNVHPRSDSTELAEAVSIMMDLSLHHRHFNVSIVMAAHDCNYGLFHVHN